MGQRTPLYDAHLSAGGKMVDFGGWDMPIHYGSQLEEHHAVRTAAGMFDVSHMTVVDVDGDGATQWLQYLLANDVARIEPGKALYSGMLNEQGGVVDDLIVYRRDQGYRLVVNCATREKDLDWMNARLGDFQVTLTEQPEMAIVAVQGPQARQLVAQVLSGKRGEAVSELGIFRFVEAGEWLIARTGYTGEDGVEIIMPGEVAADLWQQLAAADVRPCGLGARDTLRLEAGMNLYGNDMDEQVSPLAAGMGWTLMFNERGFVGEAALLAQKAAGHAVQVGLVMEGKGILRAHQKVITAEGEGEVTSGTFSPTLGVSIALARVPAGSVGAAEVEIRNKRQPVRIVQAPFVRNGQSVFKDL